MNQDIQRKIARARKAVLAELQRVAERVDCEDTDCWTICVTVEGEPQFYVPRNDRLTEFAEAVLLHHQVEGVEWLGQGVGNAFDAIDIGDSTRAARVRSTGLQDACLALGEQILQVEASLALKDGKRVQSNRIRKTPKYDPQKVKDRVAQLTKKLGNKTRAVNAAAEQEDMPSLRNIWGILREINLLL